MLLIEVYEDKKEKEDSPIKKIKTLKKRRNLFI